eukprot:COSAG01_NODE_22838_length_839_cov_1.044595_2_plen_79_part_01
MCGHGTYLVVNLVQLHAELRVLRVGEHDHVRAQHQLVVVELPHELVAERPAAATRVRCVSIFLDKNRRYIGKSQSKRPP